MELYVAYYKINNKHKTIWFIKRVLVKLGVVDHIQRQVCEAKQISLIGCDIEVPICLVFVNTTVEFVGRSGLYNFVSKSYVSSGSPNV